MLGPILAALSQAAAAFGSSGIGAAAARGAAGMAATAGHVLEDSGLTNAKAITDALRSGLGNLFPGAGSGAGSGAPKNGAGGWPSGMGGAPAGPSGMAAKFNSGNWSTGNPMRDAMLYGVPGGGQSNAAAKFAAGDWNPDPNWQGRQAEQHRRQNMMAAGMAIAPIAASALSNGVASAGGHLASTLGISGMRGLNEMKEGAGDAVQHLTHPMQWFTNPTGLAEAFLKMGKGLAHLPFDIENQSLALIDSQRELRRFSGVIANNIALLDRQDILLKARLANATAGTQSMATNSTMMLREELQPFKEFSENIKNLQQTILNIATTSLIESVDAVTGLKRSVQAANALMRVLSGEAAIRAIPANNMMNAMIANQLSMPRNIRPKPRRP